MTHGIKSLAQDLAKHGRYNDDMVAHISSDEARLLKSLGGSGTINPHTGLPEFGMFGIGGGGGILGTGINKNASDPVSNALSNNPISKAVSSGVQSAAGAVDKGLVSLDKTVGKTIPGGWGTVASVAGSMVGLPTAAMVGLGALNGSGVMRKGGKFNLQGAIMGGAMAYGASELGEYMRGANVPTEGAASAVEKVAEEGTKAAFDPQTLASTGMIESTDKAALNSLAKGIENGAGAGLQVAPPPSIGSQIMSGNFGDAISQAGNNISQGVSNLGTNIAEGASKAWDSAGNALDKATTLDTYGNAIDKGMTNASDTLSGAKNLLGAGDMTSKAASDLASASAKAAGTMSPGMAAGMTAYAGMGLAALDQQRQYLKDQAASGAISNQQYNEELAKIEAQAEEGRKVVAANPLQVNPGINGISEGPSLYSREGSTDTLYDKNPYGGTTLYAAGGAVNPTPTNPPDDQTNIANQSPIQQIGGQSSMRTLPSLGPDFNWGNMQAYQGTRADETAAMQANQAAGIQTMGSIGQPLFNPAGNVAQTSMPQSTGTGPQSYYGGSQLSNGIGGLGGMGSNQGAFPLQGNYGIVKMAAGGMPPRFLSGGGDGMSDSIHANINGSQEARLADGEFVVPADVVSHIGNGSSKAGAKQLYSMMDRVRQARTGRKSQGKQINPRKLMAA